MAYYKLIRDKSSLGASGKNPKAIHGNLYLVTPSGLRENLTHICTTLENADYLVPALIYRVAVTQSPRFKRPLPILIQVPGRSGIRFHRGSRSEHSKGCILVSAEKEKVLTELWLKEQNNHEETRIEFCDPVNGRNHHRCL